MNQNAEMNELLAAINTTDSTLATSIAMLKFANENLGKNMAASVAQDTSAASNTSWLTYELCDVREAYLRAIAELESARAAFSRLASHK